MSRRHLLAWLGTVSAVWPAAWLAALPRALQAQVTAATGARRVALVIGNAQYAQAPLANPENDARLIGSTLKALGFEVDQHLNLKAREFKRVLRDFGRRMDDDDSALVFFYAGHGMQIDRRNYLLPVDLNLRDEGEIKDESIDIEDALLARIDRVRPRARIFIIDACRDNPFTSGRTRSIRVGSGLAEMAAPGALIAFSAAPGRTAEDGPPGSNSIYSRHLAQEMRGEGIEVEEMLKNVRVKVLRDTQERQIPWVNTSMVVNFVFNPGAGALAAAAVRSPAPRAPASVPGGPVVEASAGRRTLRLAIRAERSLNTDRAQTPASLALRVYLLRDAVAFQRASFDALYEHDEATLGSALLKRESLHLRPGESRELVLSLGDDARLVAVFAAYRELERNQWRSVLPLPADDAMPPARLDAQARQVQLAWVR
ncbi:type VI secretion system lipoprotein TssJ [Aquincola sp. S2]|uniref:Type VI secretion system lipoprotein TssJ n=1 Tax=Pseudaquabacterium terrae TaxID=2732868 RepID=A0ABX2EEZ7_9BURK|nr:type VI secretion system lipoprotein TssJ [Aquabacterium terrae]NRF67183.1 type VI secretion system lipoprotein TssJ [Aquabacterium terrae]